MIGMDWNWTSAMNCAHCGHAVDLMGKFCANCGRAVPPAEAQPFSRGFEMVCLMSGVSLTGDIRRELYKTACEMGQQGCEKKTVKHPDFESTITTDFRYCAFNSMGGVKFTAEIEADKAKGKIVFLLTNFDYTEDGVWLPVMPLPQSHPASKAQYN
jgi:hypothetical protein